MATGRQQAWLGQQRVDLPHLKAIESAVAYDFDVAISLMHAGGRAAVIQGFYISETNAVGAEAESLSMPVAGSILVNYNAAETGAMLRVPDDRPNEVLSPTNPRVIGSFTPGTVNFVGVELVRLPDDSTADVVKFLDPDSDTEISEIVPLGRTLDYRIAISTLDFTSSPGAVPVAKVVTDSANHVTSITDARNLQHRLGSGGSAPRQVNPYSWPGGRNEDLLGGPLAGDRALRSSKDSEDAVKTRIWEVGGGEFWYSPTADRNVQLVSDTGFASTGEPFEVVSGNVHWIGLKFVMDNSRAAVNEVVDQLTSVPGLTDLADGECVYVDLDRTTDRTVSSLNPLVAQKGLLRTLGMSARPGSRYVIVWRSGPNFYARSRNVLGASIRLASTTAVGVARVSIDPLPAWTVSDPVAAALAMNAGGAFAATAGGLSHNRDLGTTTILTPGDLRIGRGNTAGDHNVEYFVDTDDFFHQFRASTVSDSANAASFEFNNENAESLVSAAGAEMRIMALRRQGRVKFTFDADGAFGQPVSTKLPTLMPFGSNDTSRSRTFVKKNKTWKNSVVCAFTGFGLPGFTLAGAGVGATLTATANGQLTMDDVDPGIGARVLIAQIGSVSLPLSRSTNGIYVVTAQGSPSTPWVLTRATDFDEPFDVFRGASVQVEGGTLNGGCSFAVVNHNFAGVAVDVEPIQFGRTDTVSEDKMCWLGLPQSDVPGAEGSVTFAATISGKREMT